MTNNTALTSEFKEAMERLAKPNVSRWLLELLSDWLLIGGAMTLFYHAFFLWEHPLKWVACFVAVFILGAAQHRLSLLGHDGVPHGCVLRNRKWNDFLTGLLVFWPIGFPLGGYRHFHSTHHRNVGTEQDPEWIGHKSLPHLKQWTLPFRPAVYAGYIIRDFLVIGAVPHILRAMKLIGPRSSRDMLGPILTITSISLICWWLDALWIPIVWFLALWSTFWACFRTRLWIEHAGRELVGHDSEHTYRIDVPAWLRWAICPHNGDCHWEHHYTWDNPKGRKCWSVPSWNLRKSRALIDQYNLAPPVISFREYMALLQTSSTLRPTPSAHSPAYQ